MDKYVLSWTDKRQVTYAPGMNVVYSPLAAYRKGVKMNDSQNAHYFLLINLTSSIGGGGGTVHEWQKGVFYT